MGEDYDIFKILSHETRRRILLFIGENNVASFTQLSRIEPKPGKLYYHLKVMDRLITQNEDGLYTLTKEGLRVYQFLVHDVALPSRNWELPLVGLVGGILSLLSTDAFFILVGLMFVGILLVSWYINVAVLPFYVITSGTYLLVTVVVFFVVFVLHWFYLRSLGLEGLGRVVRLQFGFLLGYYAILPGYLIYVYFLELGYRPLGFVFLVVFQALGILVYASAVSFVARLELKKSLFLPLLLHYTSSILVYMHLI